MFGFLLSQQPHPEEEVIDLVDAEVGGHEILFQLSYYNNHLIIKFNILAIKQQLVDSTSKCKIYTYFMNLQV